MCLPACLLQMRVFITHLPNVQPGLFLQPSQQRARPIFFTAITSSFSVPELDFMLTLALVWHLGLFLLLKGEAPWQSTLVKFKFATNYYCLSLLFKVPAALKQIQAHYIRYCFETIWPQRVCMEKDFEGRESRESKYHGYLQPDIISAIFLAQFSWAPHILRRCGIKNKHNILVWVHTFFFSSCTAVKLHFRAWHQWKTVFRLWVYADVDQLHTDWR